MTTLVLEVNNKQRKALKSILKYLEVSFHEVNNEKNFWNELSPAQKADIEIGLADVEAGRTKSFKEVMKKYGI